MSVRHMSHTKGSFLSSSLFTENFRAVITGDAVDALDDPCMVTKPVPGERRIRAVDIRVLS